MIRELYEQERDTVRAFFLGLSDEIRYRRFGRAMTDAALARYVDQLDWQESALLGAYDAQARLVGVLELTELPNSTCEVAVVVGSSHRGRGLGQALMDRALLKAKVRGVERIVLLCQVDNEPMRRLARSAGLTAQIEDGEVEGELDLPHAALVDVTEEVTREALGNAAYACVLATRTLAELFQNALRATAQATRLAS
jgi:RimJ/RimL family protein N-acetyltransferase